MKPFGFPLKLVRDTVKELLSVGFSDFLSVIVIVIVFVCASSVAVVCRNVGGLAFLFHVIKQERKLINLSLFLYSVWGYVIILCVVPENVLFVSFL